MHSVHIAIKLPTPGKLSPSSDVAGGRGRGNFLGLPAAGGGGTPGTFKQQAPKSWLIPGTWCARVLLLNGSIFLLHLFAA